MKTRIFLIVLLTTFTTSAQTATNRDIKIDRLIEKYNEYNQFNGAVLVAENGEIIYKNGFGFANMELDIKNHSKTKINICSLTKQFTAVLTLQLVADGRIDLNKTISDYLPDYQHVGGDKITIHHLLTHTGGIPRFRLDRYKDRYKPYELLELWDFEDLNFEPGSKWQYSNPGYFLLGVIIEKVTKKPYHTVLEENILKPLEMNDSGIDNDNALIKNRADGYTKNGYDFTNANYIDMSVPFSAGNIYSTVEDMLLWDQALYSEKLLSKKYMDLMFEPKVKQESQNRFYSYGWFISNSIIDNTKDSTTVVDHTGGLPGFSTMITRIPSKKQTVIFLTNVQGTELEELTKSIIYILNDKPYSMPKKSMADELMSILNKKSEAKAELFLKQNKNNYEFYMNENELRRNGYRLLQQDYKDKALFMFMKYTVLFPDSWNAFDSLGEVQLEMGNKKEALQSYKKAYALNSSNDHAKTIIDKLENEIRNK